MTSLTSQSQLIMDQLIKLARLGFRTRLFSVVSHSLQVHTTVDRHCTVSLCVRVSPFDSSGVLLRLTSTSLLVSFISIFISASWDSLCLLLVI